MGNVVLDGSPAGTGQAVGQGCADGRGGADWWEPAVAWDDEALWAAVEAAGEPPVLVEVPAEGSLAQQVPAEGQGLPGGSAGPDGLAEAVGAERPGRARAPEGPAAEGPAAEGATADGRVEALVGVVEAAVAELVGSVMEATSDGLAAREGAGLAGSVEAIGRIDRMLGAVRARLVVAGDLAGLPAVSGAATTGQWLARVWGLSGRTAARQADLATALDRHPEILRSLAAAAVSTEHAEGVVDGLERQRQAAIVAEEAARDAAEQARREQEEADRQAVAQARNRAERRALQEQARRRQAAQAKAEEAARQQRQAKAREDARRREADLLGQAVQGRSPEQVRRSGRHAADSEGARQDRERLARQRRELRTWTDAQTGMGYGRWSLPAEDHEKLLACIQATTTFDPADTPEELRRSGTQRRADAFTDLIDRLARSGDLPTSGGTLPQITVQIPAGALLDAPELGGHGLAGIAGFGSELSAAAVQRLGCDSAIARVITAGTARVLEVGRTTRQWSTAQRRAIEVRDGGCRFPGCDRPAGWTQIHHIRWWRHGGCTNVGNGVLLCARHHQIIHHDGWTLHLDPDTGVVTVTKDDIRLRSQPAIRPCPPHHGPGDRPPT